MKINELLENPVIRNVTLTQPQKANTTGAVTVPNGIKQAGAEKPAGKVAKAVGAVSSLKDKADQGAMAARRHVAAIAGLAGIADRYASR